MNVSLLNKREYALNKDISVVIPTLREIKGESFKHGDDTDEFDYYQVLNLFFTNPSSCIASLDQLGIDFTEISDFKLFLLLYNVMDKNVLRKISPLMFKNFDFSNFEISENTQTNQVVLYNRQDNIVINEIMYKWLSNIFCTMHLYTKKKPIIPANETAKKYIIQRALKKSKYNNRKNCGSPLDDLILALVNNSNFKYDFDSVYDLTVYNFNASARQIIKKYQVDNLYHGIYSGCVDSSKIKDSNLNWLSIDYSPIEKNKERKV